MGKGDRRTFRGKLFNCSYGKARPHSAPRKAAAAPAAPAAATKPGKR